MTVRICNLSNTAAPAGTLKLRWLATVPPATDVGTGVWKNCRYGDHETEPLSGVDVVYYVVRCDIPGLPPRASKALTLDFNTLGDADAGFDRPAVHYAEASATGDADPSNNRAVFHIRKR